MNNYYVYHLIDPETNLPFYIGKGRNGRMYQHEGYVRNNKIPNNNKHLFYRIRNILNRGLLPIYKKVYENLDEQTAFDKEAEEECRLKGQIKLCNIASCGNKNIDTFTNNPNKEVIRQKIKLGLNSLSKEEKIKIKQKRRNTLLRRYGSANGLAGRLQSIGSRRKRSLKLSGENNPMFGRVFTEEHRNKISAAGRGRKVSDETRKKISKIHKGKIVTDEIRRKISISKTGRKMSEIAKKNISLGHVGLVKSEETRRKLSISNTGKQRSDEVKKKLSDFAKTRIGNKNANFRPLSKKSEKFIIENINKPIYWIFTHLPEKASYGRIQRRIKEMTKHSS